MTVTGHGTDTESARALRGLEDDRASVRLRAALAVGSTPDPRFVGTLVERCAVEPEFFVRDMLTWALTRHPVSVTLPRLLREVRSERTRARSQALHTLSKIGDRRAWPHDHPGAPDRRRRRGGAECLAGGGRPRTGRGRPRWPRCWPRSSGAAGGRPG